MSGLVNFFLPFLGSRVSATTSPSKMSANANANADVNHANANANASSSMTTSQLDYNQSLLTATNTNTSITELEEQKTMKEWKENYIQVILRFILPRMFTTKQVDDNLYLTSREDMYYAAKFGFIPMSVAEECVSQTQSPPVNSANEDSDPNHQDSCESQLGLETQAVEVLNPDAKSDNKSGDNAQPSVPLPLEHDPNKGHNSIGRTIFPCVNHLVHHPVNSISEITLTVSSLSIPLASILNIWKQQRSKPLFQKSTGPFPYDWMRKGPLCFNYKRVVSLEIMEWELCEGTKKEIRNISRKAFGQKSRRIRVFFYNFYADAMTIVIEEAEKNMRSAISAGGIGSNKACLNDQMMVALRNIPAQCIFPMYTHDYWDKVRGKILDDEYGLVADYCICIGDMSNVKMGGPDGGTDKAHFDSDGLEIGILVKGLNGEFEDECVINRLAIDEIELGISKDLIRRGNSDMANAYKRTVITCAEQNNDAEDSDGAAEVPRRRFATASAGMKRKAQHVDRQYSCLSDLGDIYHRNVNKQRKEREVNIYATVLNFCAPRQTKKNWMLTVSIFDDSLPLPSLDASADTADPISQVKLVIFADKDDDFPLFFCAGDVLRGHRLLVDEYEGSIQLTGFAWSDILACRPSAKNLNRLDYNELVHRTDYNEEWYSNNKKIKNPLDFSRSNELWRFARKRMAMCPNVHPKYCFTNADIEQRGNANENESDHGDLTAIICDIIPYPSDNMSTKSPRGLLRIWDGTGIPRSETLASGFSVTPEWLTREEPSVVTLTALSKIVGHIVEGSGDFKHIDPDDDLEAPKCVCGRVVNVVIWEAKQWSLIKNPGTSAYFQAGKGIRIKNAVVKSDVTLSLHANSNTSITPVPDSTYEIKCLLHNHHLRIQGNHPFNTRSALLPLVLPQRVTLGKRLHSNNTIRQHIPGDSGTCTLLDCLLSPPALRCKVRFYIQGIRSKPSDGSLSELIISNNLTFFYQLFVQARDGDIDLDLLVPDRVAESLFDIAAHEAVEELGVTSDSVRASAIRAGYERLVAKFQTTVAVEAPIWSTVCNGRRYFVLADEPVQIGNEILKNNQD